MTDFRSRLQASLGDAYLLEQELGGAGMSRVYVATDQTFGRRVVVKTLPEVLSGGVSVERFRREIAVAGKLQHPHIVPLLAIGEVDGLPYYTMPFVEGASLRARLSRGELPITDTVAILRDVAKALEYAHSKGVAHRDIKPENVLLAGGSALITDFGVAKAVTQSADEARLTSTGVALGTPAYMAPEQAAADPATDLRADIYAFGAMGYEMLAGHPPFAGRSPQQMLAAHAIETPTSIGLLRPATPPALTALVMRCLEKRPGDRPQRAGELVQALDAMAGSGAVTAPSGAPSARSLPHRPLPVLRGSRLWLLVAGIVVMAFAAVLYRRSIHLAGGPDDAIRSLAVLPFQNTSGDTAFDYLEDGIPDHVREALTGVAGLTVKARSSSQRLLGKAVHEVGARLGVGVVLQGTVTRSASRLHITAELVRVADENSIWAGTFDGPAEQLLTMQDSIARAIAGKLRVVLTAQAGSSRGTSNQEAYEDFLRGRYANDHMEFAPAIVLLRDAVQRDPKFARAHAYLAMTYANAPISLPGSVDSMNRLAREEAAVALALDSTVAEAYAAQSFVLMTEMHVADALRALEHSYALDSTNVEIIAPFALTLVQAGKVEQGLAMAARAMERDPLAPFAVGIHAYTLYCLHRYAEADSGYRRAAMLDPVNPIVYWSLGFVEVFLGKPDSAVAAFEHSYRLDSNSWGGRGPLTFGYAAARRWPDARHARDLATHDPAGNAANYRRMLIALAFGDRTAAMDALARGVEAHEPILGVISMPCDPVLDPLKGDPRFAQLMQRIGGQACPAAGRWPIGAPG